jgi:hypothetical protein
MSSQLEVQPSKTPMKQLLGLFQVMLSILPRFLATGLNFLIM